MRARVCVCVFICVLVSYFFVLGVGHVLFGNNENKEIPGTSGTSSCFMAFDKERVEEVAVQNLVKTNVVPLSIILFFEYVCLISFLSHTPICT